MAQRLIDTIWGSTGTTVDPGSTKMNFGWEDEIPRYEWENFWHERVDEQLQYKQQTGVGEWIGTVTYRLNAIVMLDGVLWQSLQAGNVNHSPPAEPAWWERFGRLSMLPRRYIDGFGVSQNVGDPDGTIDVAPGVCRSEPDGSGISVGMAISAVFSKQIGAVWTEGSGLGGRASAISLSVDTWYRVFAIAKSDGTTDIGFDAESAASAANLLADAAGDGYDWARQILWVYVDSSSDIKAFWVDPNDPELVMWDEPWLDSSLTNSWSTSRILLSPLAPIDTTARFNHWMHKGDNSSQLHQYIRFTPVWASDLLPDINNCTIEFKAEDTSESDVSSQVIVDIPLDNLGRVAWRSSLSSFSQDFMRLRVLGWRFKR